MRDGDYFGPPLNRLKEPSILPAVPSIGHRSRRAAPNIGMVETRLQHLIIVTAINLIRAVAGPMEAPPARTRQSAFAALGAGQGMHFGWSGAG